MDSLMFHGPAQFCYVVPSGTTEDLRQSMYLVILQANPATEAEELAIIKKIHHRAEWDARQERKRTIPLAFDPVAEQSPEPTTIISDLLQALPEADQKIIQDHVVEGKSLRSIAESSDVSRETVRKRYNRATDRLRRLRE